MGGGSAAPRREEGRADLVGEGDEGEEVVVEAEGVAEDKDLKEVELRVDRVFEERL